jgi:hypothetical protein
MNCPALYSMKMSRLAVRLPSLAHDCSTDYRLCAHDCSTGPGPRYSPGPTHPGLPGALATSPSHAADCGCNQRPGREQGTRLRCSGMHRRELTYELAMWTVVIAFITLVFVGVLYFLIRS